MILLDTHIWVRWVDPQANPLPPGILDCIKTTEQFGQRGYLLGGRLAGSAKRELSAAG